VRIGSGESELIVSEKEVLEKVARKFKALLDAKKKPHDNGAGQI